MFFAYIGAIATEATCKTSPLPAWLVLVSGLLFLGAATFLYYRFPPREMEAGWDWERLVPPGIFGIIGLIVIISAYEAGSS